MARKHPLAQFLQGVILTCRRKKSEQTQHVNATVTSCPPLFKLICALLIGRKKAASTAPAEITGFPHISFPLAGSQCFMNFISRLPSSLPKLNPHPACGLASAGAAAAGGDGQAELGERGARLGRTHHFNAPLVPIRISEG